MVCLWQGVRPLIHDCSGSRFEYIHYPHQGPFAHILGYRESKIAGLGLFGERSAVGLKQRSVLVLDSHDQSRAEHGHMRQNLEAERELETAEQLDAHLKIVTEWAAADVGNDFDEQVEVFCVTREVGKRIVCHRTLEVAVLVYPYFSTKGVAKFECPQWMINRKSSWIEDEDIGIKPYDSVVYLRVMRSRARLVIACQFLNPDAR